MAFEDRRQHQRIFAEIPAWVATDGARVHVQTSDISFGGVQLSARAGDLVLEVGSVVNLELTIESRNEPLTLTGRVAWKRNDAVGIAFEAITPSEEKLIQRMVDSELGLAVEDQMFSDDEVTADLAGERETAELDAKTLSDRKP